MADVNNTDVRTATNASNTTRYFHLPLFIASDKPSWLVDWNGAMGDIDNILQDIATASEGAVADVATIQTQIDALNATIPNLKSLVETAVSDVAAMQTTVSSHETRMDKIEQDLITQNNLVKTLSDTVVTMQATVSTLTNRVATLESSVSAQGVNITALTSALSDLEDRVTALEQGGGGGSTHAFPSFGQFSLKETITQSGSEHGYALPSKCYVYLKAKLSVSGSASQSPRSLHLGAGMAVTADGIGDMVNCSMIIPADMNPTGFSGLYDADSSAIFLCEADDEIFARLVGVDLTSTSLSVEIYTAPY